MEATSTRFDYTENLARAGSHGASYSRFWPYSIGYELFFESLEPVAAALPKGFFDYFPELDRLIEDEWRTSKGAQANTTSLKAPASIAQVLRLMAQYLDDSNREALIARADYLEFGEGEGRIERIAAGTDEQISVFAGLLSTWFGKETRGRPSAFVWTRDLAMTQSLSPLVEDQVTIATYLGGLDKRLSLTSTPVFLPGNLAFVAGEANLHPKHIAYFFPEDEGIKRCPLKKTYYFANAHKARLRHIGWPLFCRYFPSATSGASYELFQSQHIPAAGVLAHELGHFIQRPNTSYSKINVTDRWASVALQETAADVFGTLILAELWAAKLGSNAEQALTYYLADCLGYVSRGVGLFPDSDGMLLQLNYMAEFGAIQVCEGSCNLSFSMSAVAAALRSLARVLADTLLAGDVERALALYHDFGPRSPCRVQPLLNDLASRPPRTVEYLQDFTCTSDLVGKSLFAGGSIA